MFDWLRAIFHKSSTPTPSHSQILALQSEIQTLRLDLSEREQTIHNLQADLQRFQNQQKSFLDANVSAVKVKVFSDLAPYITHLLTQTYLVNNLGKTIQNRDILSVSNNLVGVLRQHGLEIEGQVGQEVGFNAAHHAPLDQSTDLLPGQPVILRFCGITYQGTILRKAGVERLEI